MYYSLFGILALLLLLITNHDILLRKKESSPAQKKYRLFLLAVMVYYITDILWGILEWLSQTTLLFVDTELYFIAMAFGILAWTQYVIAYLEDKNTFRTFLTSAGIVFFIGIVIIVAVNVFFPIMFFFDEAGVYHEGIARNIALIIQIVILLLTSVYALRVSAKTDGAEKNRHFTIGLFGIIMLVLIAIQFFEPYLPLYAIGYMLGCSMLRTFVIENEKKEYRQDLESTLDREKQELHELNNAWKLAYTDAMTGVQSRLAFAEKEEKMDRELSAGSLNEFAIVVFDLNGLKEINDSEGHDAGDRYIKNAGRLICDVFKHSPVFRVGGDEFCVILEGQDFENREHLMDIFDRTIEKNRSNNEVVIAAGIAVFDPKQDNSFRRVFERADFMMYQRKDELKLHPQGA
ncbi:MAG: GGDEF domain-containing protein [Clostridiales bacterium]|nr:GGDEF domain-containing protein [Clostridiales bacterium]